MPDVSISSNEASIRTTSPADHTITKYMMWAAGAGFIPFPVVDIAAITAVNLKMLKTLSQDYGVDFHESQGKAFIGALIGGVLPGSFAAGTLGSLVKMVPLVGPLIGGVTMPLFAGAVTYAIGSVFSQHFAVGGTLLSFNTESRRDFFREKFEEGKQRVAANMRPGSKATTPTV